jgi:hypothetical protein
MSCARTDVGWCRESAAVQAAHRKNTGSLSAAACVEIDEVRSGHPRIHQVFIPRTPVLLNLQEAWWRLHYRAALAGHSFACSAEIALADRVATLQFNARARP